MELEKNMGILQNVYATAIAESVNIYANAGILPGVEAQKKARQVQIAPYMIRQLGIVSIDEVFTRLSDIFGCANWVVEKDSEKIVAHATTCKLCALAKKMGTASPCNGWCIDPMTAMIQTIATNEGYTAFIETNSTLMKDSACKLTITVPSAI